MFGGVCHLRFFCCAVRSFAVAFGLNAMEHAIEGFFEDIVTIIVTSVDSAADGSQFFLPRGPSVSFGKCIRLGVGKAASGLHTGWDPGRCRQKWQI